MEGNLPWKLENGSNWGKIRIQRCFLLGFEQPRFQGCIRTTLAQSSDSSSLIGRQFFVPNSNELLKIVGMQTRYLQFRQPPPQQTKHRKKFFAWCNVLVYLCGSTTSHDSTMDYSRE